MSGQIYKVLLYVWIFWLKKIEIFNGSCIICFVFSFLFIYKLSRIMSRFYFFFYEFSGKINKITTFSEIRALNKPSSCLPLKFYPGQKCLSITGKKNIENHFLFVLLLFLYSIAFTDKSGFPMSRSSFNIKKIGSNHLLFWWQFSVKM